MPAPPTPLFPGPGSSTGEPGPPGPPGATGGGGVLKKTFELNVGTMVSTTLAANAQIIGAVYFDPISWIGSEAGLTRKVYFRAILNASVAVTVTAYARIYDKDGITNLGVPQIIPGSTLSTSNASPTYLVIDLSSVLGAVLTPGTLETELYVNTTGLTYSAICSKSWLDVEWV
jgi:hypothetical protein